jgi:hypothetical protein
MVQQTLATDFRIVLNVVSYISASSWLRWLPFSRRPLARLLVRYVSRPPRPEAGAASTIARWKAAVASAVAAMMRFMTSAGTNISSS